MVADALQRLRVSPAGLHAWTEQLRLWLAAELLQPLMRLLDGAHQVSISAHTNASMKWYALRSVCPCKSGVKDCVETLF